MYYLTFNIILFDTGGLWGLVWLHQARHQTENFATHKSQVTSQNQTPGAGLARHAGHGGRQQWRAAMHLMQRLGPALSTQPGQCSQILRVT